MKNILRYLCFAVLFLAANLCVNAAEDEDCNGHHYVYVRDSYSASVKAGDYYFKSETSQLPLTVYYYPLDNDSAKAKAPVIYLDLTCYPGQYFDPNVEAMVAKAGNYKLHFPMQENLEREYNTDSTKMWYRITYDVSYRNMIFGEGVTYSIPAYVHLVSKTDAQIEIVSRSTATKCRDYVNTLPMNASLKLFPDDSESVYLWQIGEWINLQYRFLWEGTSEMTMVYGKSCEVAKGSGYREGTLVLPTQKVIWNRSVSKEKMEEWRQSDMYMRFYPESEGILTIEEYREVNHIKEMQLAGVKAILDTTNSERWLISAKLPKGVTKNSALDAAMSNAVNIAKEGAVIDRTKESYILYEAYGANSLSLNKPNRTTLSIAGKKYYTSGITVSTEDGNTDASLSSVTIDGVPFEDFDVKNPLYNGIEVTTDNPIFAAVATASTSQVEITNPESVPGTATITVTAEAGNTQLYTFNVIAGRSHDATLKNIMLNGKLIQDFDAAELYYRQEITRIPSITAEANDPKSTVEILPVKTLPGYATIIVTAEAGNQQKYSINFAMPSELKNCASTADSLTIGSQINVTAASSDIILLPIRDLSRDTTYLRFVWTGAQDVKLVMSTYCNLDYDNADENVVDTITITQERGFDTFHYDLRPTDLKRYNSFSADGNIYIKVLAEENATLSAEEWEEDCLTQSRLFEIGASYELTDASFEDLYRLYVADWDSKKIRFSWSGADRATVYVAKICDFYITSSNRNVLNTMVVTSSEPYLLEDKSMTRWDSSADRGFLYVRLVTSENGVLTTELVSDDNKESSLVLNNQFDSSAVVAWWTVTGIRLQAEPTVAGVYIAVDKNGNANKIVVR